MATNFTSSNSPRYHTEKIRGKLVDLVDHLRRDQTQLNDPQARLLFEVTAEVLLGLKKAYEDYEAQVEPAFQKTG